MGSSLPPGYSGHDTGAANAEYPIPAFYHAVWATKEGETKSKYKYISVRQLYDMIEKTNNPTWKAKVGEEKSTPKESLGKALSNLSVLIPPVIMKTGSGGGMLFTRNPSDEEPDESMARNLSTDHEEVGATTTTTSALDPMVVEQGEAA